MALSGKQQAVLYYARKRRRGLRVSFDGPTEPEQLQDSEGNLLFDSEGNPLYPGDL